MKKILFFLLFSNFMWSQMGVQVRLVDQAVGQPLFDGMGTPFALSNDAGLNAIMANYEATFYQAKGCNLPIEGDFVYQIQANGNLNLLVTDLAAYSTVISDARLSDMSAASDAMAVQIVNSSIGTPVAIVDGIVVTNDEGLNQIFTNFNVSYYQQQYPSSTWESTLRWYGVMCDCEITQLTNALVAYNAVIENYAPVSCAYLLTESFTQNETAIYPNPFSTKINIIASENIRDYRIVDLTGKQIIDTDSKTTFDNQTQNLNSGIYLLTLHFENGDSSNHKIIKK
jgi:hypothetical protein